MAIKKCIEDCDEGNLLEISTCFLECAKDAGSEVLGCIADCPQDSMNAFKDCAEDCDESNGAQGIQVYPYLLLDLDKPNNINITQIY